MNDESPPSDVVSGPDAKPWWNVAGDGARWAKRACVPLRGLRMLLRTASMVSAAVSLS